MTPKATLAAIRAALKPVEGISEGTHSGALAFKVHGKLFATLRDKKDDCEVVFGLEPEHAAALLDHDARFTAYPRAPHALVVAGSKLRGAKELAAFIRESCAIVAADAGKPRKKR